MLRQTLKLISPRHFFVDVNRPEFFWLIDESKYYQVYLECLHELGQQWIQNRV